mgnify:CR=1 FL=1|jgi:hypothetical protein
MQGESAKAPLLQRCGGANIHRDISMGLNFSVGDGALQSLRLLFQVDDAVDPFGRHTMLLPGFRSPAHFLLPGGVPKACSASLDADPVEAASEGDYNPQSCVSAGRRLR